jgi:hypothetical protein
MSTRTAIQIGLGTTLASWSSVALLRACNPLEDTPDLEEPVLEVRDVTPTQRAERAPPAVQRSVPRPPITSAPSPAPRFVRPTVGAFARPEPPGPRESCAPHAELRSLETAPRPRASE